MHAKIIGRAWGSEVEVKREAAKFTANVGRPWAQTKLTFLSRVFGGSGAAEFVPNGGGGGGHVPRSQMCLPLVCRELRLHAVVKIEYARRFDDIEFGPYRNTREQFFYRRCDPLGVLVLELQSSEYSEPGILGEDFSEYSEDLEYRAPSGSHRR